MSPRAAVSDPRTGSPPRAEPRDALRNTSQPASMFLSPYFSASC